MSDIKFNTEKKYYVYIWFYNDSGKVFYVGKGTGERYKTRKRDNSILVNIINTCNCDSKILIPGLDEEEAFNREKEMIAFYRKEHHPLINIQDGGHMPPSHKGNACSDSTKKKMSISAKKHYTEHPETLRIRSENLKNFLRTEQGKEFQRKSIEARNNDRFRTEQSIRCREANNTIEYKRRQSKIAKQTWKSKSYIESHSGAKNCRAQSVAQYDLNENFIAEYPTMTEACKATGVDFRHISLVAKGKRKTAGGFIWRYTNEKKFKPVHHAVSVYNREKSSHPVVQYTIDGIMIAEYKSISEAVRMNDFPNRANISHNVRGKTNTAYGYIWKYKQGNTVPSLKK